MIQQNSLLKQVTHLAKQSIQPLRLHLRKGFVCLFLLGILLSLLVSACSSNSHSSNPGSQQKPEIELTLVSFAVTKSAHEAIIPKFTTYWRQKTGQTVSVKRSYGASGSQTRAVIDGLEADVVHLALALDTNRLVKAGLIQQGWETETPNNGIVAKSVAALITREGNPKNIQSFADLSREGIQWVTADPKTSGIARWNFLALWNYASKTGQDEAKIENFVTQAFNNVSVLTKDARESSDAFMHQGQGDALINYENEVILAQQKGEKVSYVIPAVNISIDTPIAVVDQNVDKHGTREVAQAFVEFLYTPEAQTEFAKAGFRPVIETVDREKTFADRYPPVKTLGSIKDYGGWSDVQAKFFADGAFFDQMRKQMGKSIVFNPKSMPA